MGVGIIRLVGRALPVDVCHVDGPDRMALASCLCAPFFRVLTPIIVQQMDAQSGWNVGRCPLWNTRSSHRCACPASQPASQPAAPPYALTRASP